jgi:hypothetical protein
MRRLTLAVKTEYFQQIKSGEKKYEYRLYNDFWKTRILGKAIEEIVITLGYPKRGDPDRTEYRPYKGYEVTWITHDEFGNKPVKVFAIVVN